jgi:signal transduction histidine kinase
MRFGNHARIFTVMVVLFGLGLVAIIWRNTLQQLKFSRQTAIEEAIHHNSNLAVALEQYAIRTIHNADAILQLAKIEYVNHESLEHFKENLGHVSIDKEFSNGLGIVDTSGKLLYSDFNFSSDTVLNFRDREYFQHHLKHAEDSLFISGPLRSKTINRGVIILSRRINRPDGSFGGVVALQIEPSIFTSFYQGAELKQKDIISLIFSDGRTLARRTGAKSSYGEDISKSPLFRNVAINPTGFYFAKDALQGVPTFFSYRKLEHFPIIATVGKSEEDVLENYYQHESKDYLTTSLITILIIIFSLFACIGINSRIRNLRLIEAERKRRQQLVTRQVILAQEREREAIGRELHDNVNQVLTTVKLYLDLASKDASLRDQLICKSMQLIHSSIDEIRNLSHELSSPTLGTRSLVDSIAALVENIDLHRKLQIRFVHNAYDDQIQMEQKLAIYRIVQEQLNNIIKHAEAKNVSISLRQEGGMTRLTIQDDGKGFDPILERKGIGLNNMESRARAFQGKLEIRSAVGKGCMLTIVFPC